MQVMFCPDCIKPYPNGIAADDLGRCENCAKKAVNEAAAEAQTQYRKFIAVHGVPETQCESCGTHTLKANGVCQECEDLGWRAGDINRRSA